MITFVRAHRAFFSLLIFLVFIQTPLCCLATVQHIKTDQLKGFLKGTPVKTSDEEVKNIEDLKEHDKVASFNELGEEQEAEVEQIFENKASYYLKIKIAQEIINAAPDQEFFDAEHQKWIAAKKLTLATLLAANGKQTTRIDEIQRIDEEQHFYDITVTKNGNFCVTKKKINVHNMEAAHSPFFVSVAAQAMKSGFTSGIIEALVAGSNPIIATGLAAVVIGTIVLPQKNPKDELLPKEIINFFSKSIGEKLGTGEILLHDEFRHVMLKINPHLFQHEISNHYNTYKHNKNYLYDMISAYFNSQITPTVEETPKKIFAQRSDFVYPGTIPPTKTDVQQTIKNQISTHTQLAPHIEASNSSKSVEENKPHSSLTSSNLVDLVQSHAEITRDTFLGSFVKPEEMDSLDKLLDEIKTKHDSASKIMQVPMEKSKENSLSIPQQQIAVKKIQDIISQSTVNNIGNFAGYTLSTSMVETLMPALQGPGKQQLIELTHKLLAQELSPLMKKITPAIAQNANNLANIINAISMKSSGIDLTKMVPDKAIDWLKPYTAFTGQQGPFSDLMDALIREIAIRATLKASAYILEKTAKGIVKSYEWCWSGWNIDEVKSDISDHNWCSRHLEEKINNYDHLIKKLTVENPLNAENLESFLNEFEKACRCKEDANTKLKNRFIKYQESYARNSAKWKYNLLEDIYATLPEVARDEELIKICREAIKKVTEINKINLEKQQQATHFIESLRKERDAYTETHNKIIEEFNSAQKIWEQQSVFESADFEEVIKLQEIDVQKYLNYNTTLISCIENCQQCKVADRNVFLEELKTDNQRLIKAQKIVDSVRELSMQRRAIQQLEQSRMQSINDIFNDTTQLHNALNKAINQLSNTYDTWKSNPSENSNFFDQALHAYEIALHDFEQKNRNLKQIIEYHQNIQNADRIQSSKNVKTIAEKADLVQARETYVQEQKKLLDYLKDKKSKLSQACDDAVKDLPKTDTCPAPKTEEPQYGCGTGPNNKVDDPTTRVGCEGKLPQLNDESSCGNGPTKEVVSDDQKKCNTSKQHNLPALSDDAVLPEPQTGSENPQPQEDEVTTFVPARKAETNPEPTKVALPKSKDDTSTMNEEAQSSDTKIDETASTAKKAQDAQEESVWDMSETGRVIKGRYYTKHALERMAPRTPEVVKELTKRALKKYPNDPKKVKEYVGPRGIPPMVIEHVIKTVPPIEGKQPGTLEYINNDIKVIVNLAGDVVTVFPN